MVYKAIIRYFKKHYPRELDKIVKRVNILVRRSRLSGVA
jgi:hypothetical protein